MSLALGGGGVVDLGYWEHINYERSWTGIRYLFLLINKRKAYHGTSAS